MQEIGGGKSLADIYKLNLKKGAAENSNILTSSRHNLYEHHLVNQLKSFLNQKKKINVLIVLKT